MPRCPWATTEPDIAYHDQEWGVPVHDDRKLFEFLILEGAQAGLSWIDDSQETGELSESVRWFSRGKDRALRRARCETAARRHRDRAQPIEDRGDDPECESVSHGPERVRQFRRLPLEFCRRQTETKSLAKNVSGARADNRIRRHEPRSGAARIQVCRLNHLLRLDASDRHGQRSPRVMSATLGTRTRARHT